MDAGSQTWEPVGCSEHKHRQYAVRADARIDSGAPKAFDIDTLGRLCYNYLGSSEPGCCHPVAVLLPSCFSAGGTHTLFRPLSFCGKGVTKMTFTELCQFCLVLIGLAGLIIEIVNKKK